MVMSCVSEPSTSTLPVMPSSLQQLTPRRVESERNRGKEMVTVNPAANKSDQRSYASQNFAWRLLGKTPEETTPLRQCSCPACWSMLARGMQPCLASATGQSSS